ncbi:MAG: polysaccharide deacetylase family protein [Chitinophagaceae bacterium]
MILLSFDVEEFDMPTEYGKELSFDKQVAISAEGVKIILNLLKKHQAKATFFCTANFAIHAEILIKQIVADGHEIASHSYYHSCFKPEHLREAKDCLENITGVPVNGFRMPRMMPVDEKIIGQAGYIYNTSINPTFLPGRYNHLKTSRTYFYRENVLQIPASVSPLLRIPLFWLSFHNMPVFIYKKLCKSTYQKDSYLNLYFHPWEFTNLGPKEKYGFPRYVSRNSGDKMAKRMEQLIIWMTSSGYPFVTFNTFLHSKILHK